MEAVPSSHSTPQLHLRLRLRRSSTQRCTGGRCAAVHLPSSATLGMLSLMLSLVLLAVSNLGHFYEPTCSHCLAFSTHIAIAACIAAHCCHC